jgi:hypothetical protein
MIAATMAASLRPGRSSALGGWAGGMGGCAAGTGAALSVRGGGT